MSQLAFKVDTRLATLLSENYRSSERALKELVDNSWDADADSVIIQLPEPLTDEPIIIEDNGTGMTELELAEEYLSVARNRRIQRGDRTQGKHRQVKGRKGIGKFAGLMAASSMKVETWTRGKRSEFQFDIQVMEQYEHLSEMPLDAVVTADNSKKHGTRITLSNLHRHINFPNPDKLRQLLIQEYGRETGFQVVVNDKPLDIDDIQGRYTDNEQEITNVGKVRLRLTISDQKAILRKPGIVIRVSGKTVGDPTFFGLDKSEDFPPKLLKKCFGEIEADGLIDDVTADWGAILENSEKYLNIEKVVQPLLKEKFREVYGQEMHLAMARLKKKIKERLASLPEYKRIYADRAIKKILDRFYREPEHKAEPIVNVLLDAIERSEYRIVLEHINDARHSDVSRFAEALDEFGLLEMARMIEQTQSRLNFLEYLDQLCNEPKTLEKDVHKAIERNLWLFGPEYSLFSSNSTLKKQIENFLNKKYIGDLADKRPDLLLNQNLDSEYLLIEFKKPAHSLRYEDYQQATAYRNELRQYTTKENIQVWLIGGKKGRDLPTPQDIEKNVRILLFSDVISIAKKQLDWLITEMNNRSS